MASSDRPRAQNGLEPISGLRQIRSRFLLVHAIGQGWHPPNGLARRATVVRRRTERASHCGCLTRTTVRTHTSATHPQVMKCAVTMRGRASILPGVERLGPASDWSWAPSAPPLVARFYLGTSDFSWNRLPASLPHGRPEEAGSGQHLIFGNRLGRPGGSRIASPGVYCIQYIALVDSTVAAHPHHGETQRGQPGNCVPWGEGEAADGPPVLGPSVSDVGVPARGHPNDPSVHRGLSTPATVACFDGSGRLTVSAVSVWHAVIGARDGARPT